ncbi:MAG: FlgD immunoglobulin-like domain containing protein [Nanoarchaeota archaeon]
MTDSAEGPQSPERRKFLFGAGAFIGGVVGASFAGVSILPKWAGAVPQGDALDVLCNDVLRHVHPRNGEGPWEVFTGSDYMTADAIVGQIFEDQFVTDPRQYLAPEGPLYQNPQLVAFMKIDDLGFTSEEEGFLQQIGHPYTHLRASQFGSLDDFKTAAEAFWYNYQGVGLVVPSTSSGIDQPRGKNTLAARCKIDSQHPFRQGIAFQLELEESASVKFGIYDLQGRRMYSLNEGLSRGDYRIAWDGRSSGGIDLPSGKYYARIDAYNPQSKHSFREKIDIIKLR